jgi:CubicO group peptidase (beta-lactamase class C family)
MSPEALPRATPESQGVDSNAIAAFVREANSADLGLHSLMILRHGHVIAEGWWKPYTAEQPHMMFSVSKSITATAIGIAEAEGLLSVEDPILSFFPTYATEAIRKNVAEVKVRHLLSMATGHAVDTMEIMRALPNADWVDVFLSVPIEFPPGTHFLYNSGASFVLSAIIASRTGQTAQDYLSSRLFGPIGMETPPWESNNRGINLGASGVRLRTEDLARIGQLYLQRGLWDGNRVLTEDWIDKATAVQVSNGSDPEDDWSQGYGFQIWRSKHRSYRMDGRYGQFSFVLPDQDAVVAITAGTSLSREIPEFLWRHLLPGMRGEALPAGHGSPDALGPLLAAQEVRVPTFVQTPGWVTVPTLEAKVPFNTLHVTSVRLEFLGDETRLVTVNDEGASESVPAGAAEWLPGVTALWPYEEMQQVSTASRAGWIDEHSFEVHQQCTDTPFRRIWRFEFDPTTKIPTVIVRLDNGFWVERTEVLPGEPIT